MSLIYAGGVQATGVSNIKAQLATLFAVDTVTGIKTLNVAAMEAWVRANVPAGSPSASAFNPGPDLAVLAQALSLEALGYNASTFKPSPVTATGVAAKKAELEALGLKVDAYFETFVDESSKVLANLVTEMLGTMDLSKTMPEVTARVVDPRFYVTTWVTAWGEESSPSAPTDMVQVDQNDVCVVTPNPTGRPTDRGIVGWRLYRSNSGSNSGGFQLVPDLALISNLVPEGDRDSVVRQIYAELGHVGLMAPTDNEVAYWVQGSAGWTNAVLRTNMITSAANTVLTDATRYYAPVVARAKSLLGGFSLLQGGAYSSFNLTTLSYADAAKAGQLQETLATTTWLPPPTGLRGLTSMANGVMAGFVGNTVCFSEAYTPYAWPVEYQITMDYPVVAVAAFGQSLFVGTRGSVHVISGADPSSMSDQILTGGQSCVSARSVVALDGGVIFASPEGVCLADLSGVKVLTAALFTRADWTKLVPSSMVGMLHDGSYYFLYDKGIETDPFRPEYTLTPAQVIAKTYADIKQVPTAPETNFWLGVQSTNGWSNFTLRLKMLETAASFIGAKGYKSQAEAAEDLLNLDYETVVDTTYIEIGRTPANGNAPTQAEIDFWVFGAGQLSLTNTELRQAMLNAAAFYTGSLDASLANEALRDQVSKGCYALDTLTGKLTQFDLFGTAFYRDTLTDTLYLVSGTQVQALFGAPHTMPAVYRTPVIQSPKQSPMAWLQVDSDWSTSVTVTWYGDGVARHTVTLTGPEPVRLPAGRYREHEIMLLSSARVTKVTLASTTEELQNV